MKITLALIGICIAVFVLQNFLGAAFTNLFVLNPKLAFSGYIWQFITYMFLHADPVHLFLNMIGLFIFGFTVENTLGRNRYIGLFIISGIVSSLFFLLINQLTIPDYMSSGGFVEGSLLGASGAVFGVMAAYGLLYPKNWIIMFPGIPMPAIVAVFFFAGIEIFFGVTRLQGNIANWGHLGGLLSGVLITYFWKRRHRKPKLIDLGKNNRRDWEFVWE